MLRFEHDHGQISGALISTVVEIAPSRAPDACVHEYMHGGHKLDWISAIDVFMNFHAMHPEYFTTTVMHCRAD